MVASPAKHENLKVNGMVQPRWAPSDHYRIYSQSTTASPAIEVGSNKGLGLRKAPAAKTRKSSKTEINANVRKKYESTNDSYLGIQKAKNSIKGWDASLAKTPSCISSKQVIRRAGIFCSPGGTDYLITPGRHKISMTEFLSSFDREQSNQGCPALRAVANYHENMLRMWLEREKLIDPNVYMLSFKEGTPLEQFRQMAIQCIFNYAVEHRLHEKTVHLTCLNVSRLIHARLVAASAQAPDPWGKDSSSILTHDLFACIVMTSLRHAVKCDESFEKSEMFRIDPNHVWSSSKYLSQVVQDRSVKMLNKMEIECLALLDDPPNPPLAPDFLDRYLGVGGWPQYKEQYRELASYLIGLALFANTYSSPLKRVPHSQLAAAALVLAIKVINTDHNSTKYEFWPQRLVQYTGLTMDNLKPAIRGLANLLRNKPRWSNILESYYGKWSEYDWN